MIKMYIIIQSRQWTLFWSQKKTLFSVKFYKQILLYKDLFQSNK